MSTEDRVEAGPCTDMRLTIPGPAGGLQAVVSCPKRDLGAAIGVACHPHPLYGGSMHNKVVYYTARTFNQLGAPALRFNFRGVEESGGRYDEGEGEVGDLAAVLDWSGARYPGRQVWLAGFSFGAYVALRLARRPELARLITIAPSVGFLEASEWQFPRCPWLLVHGEKDEVVAPQAVRRWLRGLERRPRTVWLPDADHFFHGSLTLLRGILLQWLAPPEGSAC